MIAQVKRGGAAASAVLGNGAFINSCREGASKEIRSLADRAVDGGSLAQ